MERYEYPFFYQVLLDPHFFMKSQFGIIEKETMECMHQMREASSYF